MLYARLGALTALAFTLVLSACSTNDALTGTTDLEPQFGTRGYDEVTDVAYGKALSLYTVGVWDGVEYPEYNLSEYQDAFVRRYDRNGNMLWEKYLDVEPAYENYIYHLNARAVAVDNGGNAIVAWSVDYTDSYYDYEYDYYRYEVVATFNYLTKYSSTGSQIWRVKTNSALTDLATDSSSNVYATSDSALIKYTSSGSQSWSRSQPSPTGVAVSSTNNVYIVRYDGVVVKFNSSGTQLYLKTGQLGGYNDSYKIATGVSDEVYVTTNYLVSENYGCEGITFSDYTTRVYKLSNTGVRQWLKDAARFYDGSSCFYNSDAPFDGLGIATDTVGNIYVGSHEGDYDNQNGFIAKYSRTGTLAWKKGFGTPKHETATGVATYDGSEVFVGGVTKGFLVHRQLGGGGDAVIREVNSSGNLVWAR